MTLHFSSDLITREGAAGWAFSEDGAPVIVEAWCDGVCLGAAAADRVRPDVGANHPEYPFSGTSGYYVTFVPRLRDRLRDQLLSVEVRARARKNSQEECHIIGTGYVVRDGSGAAVAASPVHHPSFAPFPRLVMSSLESLWPDAPPDLFEETAQRSAAERIVTMASLPDSNELFPFMHYVRFLRSVWTHFQFVQDYFPATNQNRDAWAKDFFCRANTPEELLSIAHHLYVLKSYDVPGDFAEFGCFKGYSSSMLSFACHQLGIRMHIFDSFEGLPASTSPYYEAGDFSASLEEVKCNVEIFGAPGAVTYHKGYFSTSLQSIGSLDLMCLWMDIDLESSARDVMTTAHRIDPRGAIFTHECKQNNFDNGTVSSIVSPDHVLPPILDRVVNMGERPVGRFLRGQTGCLWREGKGIPVLSNAVLMKMIQQL